MKKMQLRTLYLHPGDIGEKELRALIKMLGQEVVQITDY